MAATPLLRDSDAAVSRTAANAVANNAYANAADAVRLSLATIGTNYLLADFRLTNVTFGVAPVAGTLQLIAVDRDFSGNQGPTPSASMQGRLVGVFSPTPQAANALTGWIMSVNSVPLTPDADYWIFNSATGQTLNAGWTLTATPWSPGT